ncbi:hypothetical protein AMJ85_10690 [candidate division BRC1 bacterium SM23_51]|nr:MAG: hypothetical protein AMJ85_10690 [candidate division BRC1 bacterium SM23_51]
MKTKKQLVNELAEMRQRIAELEASQATSERNRHTVEPTLSSIAALAEALPVAVVVYQGPRIIQVNAAAERISGYTREELLNMHPWQTTHPDFRESMKERALARQRGEHVASQAEVKILTKSGEERWLQVAGITTELNGKPAGIGISLDITEQKRAQEALEAKQRHLAMAQQIANLGSWERHPDTGKAVWSDWTYRLLGLDPRKDEATFETFLNQVHPDDRERVRNAFEKAYQGTKHYEVEFRIVRPDGAERVLHSRAEILHNDNDVAARILGIVQDITERQRAQDALEKSERKYRTLIENIPDVTWTSDREGNTAFICPNVERVYGYSPEEIYAQGRRLWIDRVHPDDVERVVQAYRALFDEGGPFDVEYRIQRKDGQWIWLHDRAVATHTRDGVLYADGIFSDITERKRAEAALRESDETTRALLNAPADPLVLLDREGTVLAINELGAARHGRTPDELVGSYLFDLFPDDLAKSRKARVDEVIRSGKLVRFEDERGGRVLDNTLYPVFDAQGRVERVAVSARDVTNFKQAMEALRASETRFRTLAETSPVPIFIYQGTKIRYFNPRVVEWSGYTREELQAMDFWEFMHPDFRDLVRERGLARLRGEDVPARYEVKVVKKNGEELWAYFSAARIEFEGQPAVVGVALDINELKRTEEALRQSKRELAVRNKIAGIFLTVADEEMYSEVLQVILQATESRHGVFGYLDENGDMVVPSMTRHIWDQCQIPDKNIVFPRETWGDSSWPRAIREKKTLYSNQRSKLAPEGHIPIQRNVAVPIVHGAEVIGLLHVANKETDYGEEDIQLLEGIAGYVAPVLHARLHRDRQERERKKAAQHLVEHQEQLRRLASELSLAEERERRHIASELHDRVSQDLTLAGMKLDALRQSGRSAGLRKGLREVHDLVQRTLRDVRTLVFDLSPPILYDLGLAAALKWLSRQAEDQYGVATVFEEDGQCEPIPDDTGVIVFRMVRELLINIGKHAQARSAKVSMARDDNHVRISVEDDGMGFDVSAIENHIGGESRFGLFSIRERLRYLGGELEVESESGRGTRATLVVPLERGDKTTGKN